MDAFFNRLLVAFISMFVAVDAIGNIPFFLSLTEGLDRKERRHVANLSVMVAIIIVIIFMIGGRVVFNLIGITLVDIRIAGGILLLSLSIHMLVAGKTSSAVGTADVAIFPLASPLLAGPAVLTTALVLAKGRGWLPALIAIIANLFIAWFTFRYAERIELLITPQGAKAFSKVVEILLAAIAVMFIRHGIIDFLAML